MPTLSASAPPLYHRPPCPYTLATPDTLTIINITGTIHLPSRTEKLIYRRRRPTVAATAEDMAIALFRLHPGQILSFGSGSMRLTQHILEESQCMSCRMLS